MNADRNEAHTETVRIGLPKGRMQKGVLALLADAGVEARFGERSYRPQLTWPGFESKLLKPQNVVEMLHAGSRDIGFAGADWVAEMGVELVELLDTGLDPVRVVAAAPARLVDGEGGASPDLPSLAELGRPLVVATEYVRLGEEWIRSQPFEAVLVRSFGATEVFPPEDSDLIIDNTATGTTLRQNGLEIVDTILRSSTRLYANQAALDDPERSGRIHDLVVLLTSVLEARNRVMLELNVSEDDFAQVVSVLPCMRQPTVSRLHGESGYAVRAAVPKSDLPQLLLKVKAKGGTDLVVSQPQQIVP